MYLDPLLFLEFRVHSDLHFWSSLVMFWPGFEGLSLALEGLGLVKSQA
jgi:hypothetical protein